VESKKVYLLSNDDWTQFKIGISKNDIKVRINNLKTGNGSEISLVSVFESPHYKKIEKMLHKKHHSKRLVGEWFSLNDDDITNFKSDCLKLHEAFEYLKQSKNPFI
jgi:hypothetical protein